MIIRFTSFLFAILATVSLIAAILFLYPRFRFQDENFYNQAFTKSDFSAQSQEVIQNNLDSYLKDKLKVNEDNQFPPGLSAVIIRAMINRVDMDQVMSETLSKNSSYLSNWLSGESELYLYFPREKIISAYQDSGGDTQFITDIIKMAGYENLPDCSSPDQISQADFLRNEVSCGGPLLREFINNEIRTRTRGQGDSLVEGFLNSVASGVDEQTALEVNDSEFFHETRLWELPNLLGKAKLFGMIAVVATIVTLTISVWLSVHPAESFLKVLLNTSVVLIVFSLVAKVALRITTDFVLWSKISFSPQAYSQEQIDEILGLFKDFFGAMLDGLLLEIMIIGFVTLAVVVILYILFRFAGLITSESDEEDEDFELEEEDAEEGHHQHGHEHDHEVKSRRKWSNRNNTEEDAEHENLVDDDHEDYPEEDNGEVAGEDFEKKLLEQKPQL